MLSGDMAYELFMSNDPFPLHSFLDEWKAGKLDDANNETSSGYVLAVIGAYNTMCDNCHDGRYNGVRRKRA